MSHYRDRNAAPAARVQVVRAGRAVLQMRGERVLVARMLAWRLVLPFLKRTLPIQRLVRLMRTRRPAPRRLPGSAERIGEIAALVCRPRLLRSHDKCLERSLIAYRYLSAIGTRPELVIGVRRDAGDTSGHAWVALDGKPVVEAPHSLEPFTELIGFTAEGMIRSFRDAEQCP